MASLGQELKRERELRGISLKEISDSSKISLKFLTALEEDRLDLLPGEFFIKGIIRTYAKNVGLDEDYALNKYYEVILLQEEALKKEQKKTEIQPKFSRRKILFASTILFVVLLTALLLYFLSLPKKVSPLPERVQIPSESLEPRSLPPPVVEAFVEEKKEMNIIASFLEMTWIQVYADGELAVDGIKMPGDEFQVKALKELIFHLGNAGGISFTLNGKKGKPFGPSGTVLKNIRITLDNYRQFLLAEEENKNLTEEKKDE